MVEGEELQERSDHNRLRLQDLPPWRGMIMDRNGQVLVANRPSYDLVVVMEDVTDIPLLARRLAKLLHLEAKNVQAQLEAARSSGLAQVRVKGDLSWDEMALVETFQPEMPGALIQVQPKREYLQKGRACHVLGYLGEITEAQMKSGRFPNYKMGDALGKCGIEAAWEKYLRGKRGYRRIEVDGKSSRELVIVRPQIIRRAGRAEKREHCQEHAVHSTTVSFRTIMRLQDTSRCTQRTLQPVARTPAAGF